MLPTGIASACSSNYYFQIFERGSTGVKGIGQRSGVIDSSYRGEWFIPITNHNPYPIIIVRENMANTVNMTAPEGTIIYPMEKR